MTRQLSTSDMLSLEQYDIERDRWRQKVRAHKAKRRVAVGNNITCYFEDRLTIWYQIQEMLRIEKIFTQQGIQEELDTYNPLIPDGTNWKATMMIEYSDIAERKKMLGKLMNIENQIWIEVDGYNKIFAIADEDLERGNPEHTSAVHFLRFEFTPEMIAAIKAKRPAHLGVTHPEYPEVNQLISDEVLTSLSKDLL